MRKGDRVKHPAMPEWGIGRIMKEAQSGKIEVFFVNAGNKILAEKTPLRLVMGTEASHPLLENLKIRNIDRRPTFRTLTELKNRFTSQFPGGFHGKTYVEAERNYKVEAHELANRLLEYSRFKRMLSAGSYGELCSDISRVMQKTNLVFPNEQMDLRDGLKTKTNQRNFATSLFTILFSEEDLEKRFISFCITLQAIGAAKWTIVSYFLFIMYPNLYMFMKPVVTMRAAEICGFELNYKPQLNWLTYMKLLEFSKYLNCELQDLEPRDMIDVQSFIWCTGGI